MNENHESYEFRCGRWGQIYRTHIRLPLLGEICEGYEENECERITFEMKTIKKAYYYIFDY
jgi:hypothetical protein